MDHVLKQCQYPVVLACTPDLPMASSEGRGELLGLGHLEWHNLTLLANFTRHKRENSKYAKASKKLLKWKKFQTNFVYVNLYWKVAFLRVFWAIKLHRPSAPIQSLTRNVRILCVCLCVPSPGPCEITEYSQNPEYLVSLKLEISALEYLEYSRFRFGLILWYIPSFFSTIC